MARHSTARSIRLGRMLRRPTTLLIGFVVAALTALSLGAGGATATGTPDYPVQWDGNAALTSNQTLAEANAAPSGANHWDCKPTAAHPNPVVLLHGTAMNMAKSFAAVSPLLANDGYCVYALNYGGPYWAKSKATGDIPTSAKQLDAFVDKVLASTGAHKIDIVSHSQGGLLSRYYTKFLGGAANVGQVVMWGTPNHGTDVSGVTRIPFLTEAISPLCAACRQQARGSAFLGKLNAGGETVPGVRYTVIQTTGDTWFITPNDSPYLTGPADQVTNITLQNVCSEDTGGHFTMGYSPNIVALTFNALDPAHAQPVKCVPYDSSI